MSRGYAGEELISSGARGVCTRGERIGSGEGDEAAATMAGTPATVPDERRRNGAGEMRAGASAAKCESGPVLGTRGVVGVDEECTCSDAVVDDDDNVAEEGARTDAVARASCNCN